MSHPQRSDWHEKNNATGHFIYYDLDLEMGTADLAVSGPKGDHIHVVLFVLLPSIELTNSVGSLQVKILRSASFAPPWHAFESPSLLSVSYSFLKLWVVHSAIPRDTQE